MATKGWSFGGLTDALKSGAFTDAAVVPIAGQMPILNPQGNLFISGTTGASNGIFVSGSDNNQIGMAQRRSASEVPKNDFASILESKWNASVLQFGIVRSVDTTSLGYAINWNNQQQYMYRGAESRHKLRGSVHSTKFEVGPQDTTTTGGGEVWASLQAPSKAQITLKHQSKEWNFMPTGGITLGAVDADTTAGGLRCIPSSGSWETIYDRSAGLLVDLTGGNASTIIRAALWGTANVFAIEAAYSANRSQARMQWGGTFVHFDDINDAGATTINLSRGSIQAAAGDIIANRNLVCYNGEVKVQNAIFARDGNAYGTAWGGWLSNWLSNNNNQIYGGLATKVVEIRWANERYRNTGERGVITRSQDNGTNAYISDLQFYRDTTGWVTTGWV